MWLKFAKLLGVGAFVALLALWGSVMKEDLNLTVDLVKNGKSFNLEIGGLSTVRKIGEDVWEIFAGTVIRKTPVEDMKEIRTKILGPSGLRTVNAPEGSYDSEKGVLILHNADGVWERAEYPMEWSTPHAIWEQKGELWTFPKGVTVSGDVYGLTGTSAVMKKQQEIHIENGCIRWWK